MKTFSLYNPLLVRKFRISIIVTLFVLFTTTTIAQTCSYCPPMSLSINYSLTTAKKYITFDKTIADTTTLKQVLNLPNSVIHRFEELSVLNAVGDILTTNLTEYNWAIIEDIDIQNNELTDHSLIYSEIPVYITNNAEELVITHLMYVKLVDSTDFHLLENIAANNNIEILGRNKFMPLWYTLSCNKNSTGNALEMAELLYQTGLFATVQPDFLAEVELTCTNDPLFPLQWGAENTGQNGGTPNIDINLCQAQQITTGSNCVVVAVIDGGFDKTHPDLINNINSSSFNINSGTSPSQINALAEHGSNVAGIIAASKNNIGMAGVAPDCSIMVISWPATAPFPGDGLKYANGVNFAWQHGASVINNSWRITNLTIEWCQLKNAYCDAMTLGRNGLGTVVVFSSGNDNLSSVDFPGNFHPDIITVGAMSPCGERKNYGSCDGEINWGSNYGSQLDVVAPGVFIPTTSNGSGYNLSFNGTSSAAPHVSGVAALILSVNPCLTQRQVGDIIEATAQKTRTDLYNYQTTVNRPNGTWHEEMGYGLVDAEAAVALAKSMVDFTAVVDECGKVIVDISSCFNGYNVNWNFGDGFGTSSSASTSYVYSNSGTFTITLTVSLGVCSQTFTQQVTVNTCCTAPTTIPVAGANSSAYGSGFSGTTIAINGDFIIDNNFVINNKTVLMAPNTKIIILPGKTLNISKSELYSCGTDMWDGIEIRPGGRLILQNKSVIEDAKIAVLSDNNGGIANFIIRNSTFNRNYIGIKVQQHQTGTPHPGTIQSTTFDSRPSTTTTTNTRQLDAPYQNQTAETGIELSSVNSFVVGSVSSPTAKNTFKYLLKGIHALNSVYTVYNNEFSDNAQKGWAIYNYKGVKTIVGGSGNNQPNLFKNLYNGISHRSSSDLLVEFNSFENINLPNVISGNNATTVYTHECNKANITLYRNDVKSVTNGFVHFKNADARYTVKNNTFNIFNGKAVAGIENSKGTIEVLYNTITGIQSPIYAGNTAIYVVGTGITFSSSTVLKIYYNTISKANKGIHVINIGRPEIKQNTITFAANIFPSLSEFYFGIRSQNGAREEIHSNTIDKTGANPSAAIINALYGISVENSSNIPAVSENTVKKMGSGFRFRGFYDEADFRCNTLTNNWYGLVIDNAKIGNQGEAPSVTHPNGMAGDNSWTDPSLIGSSTAIKGYGTLFSPAFYTRSAGYPFTPPDVLPLSTISTFYSTPSIPLNQNADQLCQTICYDPETCKIPKLAKIARNETPYDQIVGTNRFSLHESVLKTVWQDSLVLDTTTTDGSDLQQFIDTVKLSNVGLVVEVSKLMAAKDTLAAEQLNQSINPKECADAFHKTVNEIYFRTWAKNVFEFTSADSNTLTNIALQDPLVCGTAIYTARVMLNKDVNDYSVDNNNSNRLMNTTKTEAASTPSTSKGKWYPNPAKDEVNYEIQLLEEQSGQLMVVDLTGKIHATAILNGGNNKITFDVKILPNGIYFYRVMVNNKIQEVNKFIIQH